jgi:hypothetical protein
MLRRLLNIASIVCLILCVALMGLWVRSARHADEWKGRLTGSSGFLIKSDECRLVSSVFVLDPNKNHSLPEDWPRVASTAFGQTQFMQIPTLSKQGALYPWGFSSGRTSSSRLVMLPYWFLVLASGMLAILFQLRSPWQFNLRSMLLLTTLLAVVLGMIAWLDRAWIGK